MRRSNFVSLSPQHFHWDSTSTASLSTAPSRRTMDSSRRTMDSSSREMDSSEILHEKASSFPAWNGSELSSPSPGGCDVDGAGAGDDGDDPVPPKRRLLRTPVPHPEYRPPSLSGRRLRALPTQPFSMGLRGGWRRHFTLEVSLWRFEARPAAARFSQIRRHVVLWSALWVRQGECYPLKVMWTWSLDGTMSLSVNRTRSVQDTLNTSQVDSMTSVFSRPQLNSN